MTFSLLLTLSIAVPRVSAQTVRVLFPSHLTATYRIGDSHNSIKAVQILLNQTTCPIKTDGTGSQTRETEYFGSLTEQAVRCFQHLTGQITDGAITPAFYAALLTAVKTGSAAPRVVPQRQERPQTPQERSTAPVLPVATESRVPEPRVDTQIQQQQIQQRIREIELLSEEIRRQREKAEAAPPVGITEPTTQPIAKPTALVETVPQRLQLDSNTDTFAPSLPFAPVIPNPIQQKPKPRPEKQERKQRDAQPQPKDEALTEQEKEVLFFSRDLTLGSIGEDVRQLQIFLNKHGYIVNETGLGSPGKETTYFGEKTHQALVRFQHAHDIITPPSEQSSVPIAAPGIPITPTPRSSAQRDRSFEEEVRSTPPRQQYDGTKLPAPSLPFAPVSPVVSEPAQYTKPYSTEQPTTPTTIPTQPVAQPSEDTVILWLPSVYQ